MVSEGACVDLTGQWKLAAYDGLSDDRPPVTAGLDWISAQVPGAVHYDLVAAGRLKNPLASSQQAAEADWVPRSDWLYRRTFDLSEEQLAAPNPMIVLDSVDTFADVWVNGHLVGSTDNMFRRWRFSLAAAGLGPVGNELLIHVKSHYRVVADMVEPAADIAVASNPTAHRDRSLIRRYQRSFNGSLLALGETVIGMGIPQPVRLCFYPEDWVSYAALVTDAVENGTARVHVAVELSRDGAEAGELRVETTLLEPGVGVPVAQAARATRERELSIALEVPEARLWWPRGYGEPFLYDLRLRLYRGDELLFEGTQRVGIKQVELVQRLPDGRRTFFLRVNGVKVHVRGGNLMPIDAIQATPDMDAYERLLRLVVHGNMNLIRIWGGGVTEREAFLDRCDELGIMLWQDFFYHSCTYPDHLDEFMLTAEAEAVDLVRTMRPHASLVLLCGGNEQIQGWDEWHWKLDTDRFYGERLMNELLPEVSARQAPEIPYIPNSPHGGRWCQSPTEGDTHTWGNHYNATKDPLFVTETCWNLDSYSRPETLAESMDLDVDALAEGDWRGRWQGRTGLRLLTKYPYSSAHDAPTLRAYLHGLELEQLEADEQSLSMLRLRSPSCNGIVYWPLNKGGPLFGFGGIDYRQRPLMTYYGLRRLFADVVIELYRDVNDVRVVASNAGTAPFEGILTVWHLSVDGEELGRWEQPVSVEPGNALRLLDLPGLYEQVQDRTREILYAELTVGEEVVARDRLFFCPITEVVQPEAGLDVWAEPDGPSAWRLTLRSDAAVVLVELQASARVLFGDDYFFLAPQRPRTIEVEAMPGTEGASVDLSVGMLGRSARQTVRLE